VQTVPRPQLFALKFLLDNVEENSNICFVTDSKINYDLYNRGEHKCRKSNNADLFISIFDNIILKHIQLHIKWIPSHLKEKLLKDSRFSLPNGVTIEEVEGNSVADILAEVAAHANELPLHITRPYLRNIRLVKRIQLRLAAILTILPNRPKQISSAIKRSYLSITEEIEISDHTVFPPSTYFPFYHCACCKSYIAQHSSSLRSWIRSSCLPVQDDSVKPVPLPIGTKINNKPGHISHRIFSLQGTTYCIKCGAYGSPQRVQNLLKECGPITTAGSNFLAHIKNEGVVPNGSKYSVPTVLNIITLTLHPTEYKQPFRTMHPLPQTL
jgi:hypothetical protein